MDTSEEYIIQEKFGKAIKKRRAEIGLSQEELAMRAGIHRTYISDVERGERNISLRNIFRISKALEISIAELFSKYI